MFKDIQIIIAVLLISACGNSPKKAQIAFDREVQIDNELFFGYNTEGKCIPFTRTISRSRDTIQKINHKEYHKIDFSEDNKLYCYIETQCSVPMKISVFEVAKLNDQELNKKIITHTARFSNYPKDQQLFISELMKINDAIITREEKQKRMEIFFSHKRSFSDWKFTLIDKEIEALLGSASWVDFTCEDFKFRFFIHNTVSEAFDHTLGDESHDAKIHSIENKFKSYEIGKQYTLSGVINEDKYGFSIALKNPISFEIY
jgi:hypothetical protein